MSIIKNAALVAVTAILVTYLPKYFQTLPEVVVDGQVAPGFEPVLQIFRENFESGREDYRGGSAFVAYHKGKKVVDVWGGYADLDSKQAWKKETMAVAFSATKGISCICLAMLVDRGLLDYEKPVVHYWPEFATKGKGKDTLTVRQMLDHKGGLTVAAPPGITVKDLQDVAHMGEIMARSEPQWEIDGKTHGYHAYTFGPLTNELMRRVDPQHRTLGQFFKEEIAEPLGVDFFIGLPLGENYRVARLYDVGFSMNNFMIPSFRQLMWYNMKHTYLQDILENAPELSDLRVYNTPEVRSVELASANGVGTAEALAKVYGILSVGGTDPVTKKKLLSQKRIDEWMNANPETDDIVFGIPLTHTLGMITGNITENGNVMFGHPGAGGQLGFADPKEQVSIGYVTNTHCPALKVTDDPRSKILIETLYDCIAKLKN